MENGHQLIDLFDIDNFQKLQDNFAKALDLGFITVDYRGRPILKYSGFTEFCNKIRKREDCLNLCYQCDAHGGLHATITGEPYIYRCHAGLVDFAVPLILEGKYMGSVMGGQVELIGDAPELKPILSQTIHWQDDPELVDAVERIHKVTYEKLVASVYLLRDMMQNMMEEQYRKVTADELEEKKRELREEKAARMSLEEDMEKDETAAVRKYFGNDYMFYVLNVIAKLAYRENAKQTEEAVCDFSGMLRYINENLHNHFVTIGEELEYIGYYLRIQQYRLEGQLQYSIDVPEKLHGVLCPFMLLQPLVENALKYSVEMMPENGAIAIEGEVEGGLFVLRIRDNGKGMSGQLIDELLSPAALKAGTPSKNYLTNLNRRLKGLFTEACGVQIRSADDGISGTEIQVRLPLKNGRAIE